jgi:hypothetical protein
VDLARRIEPAVVNVRRFVKDEKWWTSAQARSVKVAPGWVQVPERDLCIRTTARFPGASGVVVSADGYILTLNRVLLTSAGEEADIIDVELGGDHYRAKDRGPRAHDRPRDPQDRRRPSRWRSRRSGTIATSSPAASCSRSATPTARRACCSRASSRRTRRASATRTS